MTAKTEKFMEQTVNHQKQRKTPTNEKTDRYFTVYSGCFHLKKIKV